MVDHACDNVETAVSSATEYASSDRSSEAHAVEMTPSSSNVCCILSLLQRDVISTDSFQTSYGAENGAAAPRYSARAVDNTPSTTKVS